ncbi:YhhN-like protein [Globomyces pollinis-pini]|nr:YhhN-like protein [Globomyces pollinis-pini]
MTLIDSNVTFVTFSGSVFFHLYLVANPASNLNTSLIRTFSKCLPILMMSHKVRSKKGHAARSIATGLTLSAIGDAFLANEENHPSFFIGGLASFLVAHLYYVAGLNHSSTKKSKSSWSDWFTPIATYCGVYSAISYFILPSTPSELKIPVFLYGTAIASMIWKAIDGSLATGHIEGVLGALVFGVSDFILAYSKFVGPIKHGHMMVMVTYYLAQTLISKFALK